MTHPWFSSSHPHCTKSLKNWFQGFSPIMTLDPFATTKRILLRQKFARTVLIKHSCNSMCCTQTGPHGASGPPQSWSGPSCTSDISVI